MAGRVEGKVAFVTGAARGQGRSHAVRLAEEGADIIAIDICGEVSPLPTPPPSQDDLDETVRQVEALDRRVVSAVVDVRDYDALRGTLDEGVSTLGRLDIVCANAGITAWPNQAHEIPPAAWQEMLDVNLTGVWNTARAAVPHLIAGGRGGSIILTSSLAGLVAYANSGHYVAAKHGVVGLMRTMAIELGPHFIRVNTVNPGNTNTDMLHNEEIYKMFRPDLEHPTREDFAAAAAPLQAIPVPWVEPVDISNAVLFLASDESRYVTGLALPVDAGFMIK